MNRIMSTSIILLVQTFNTNDVDIMVFEPSVLFPPPITYSAGLTTNKSFQGVNEIEDDELED